MREKEVREVRERGERERGERERERLREGKGKMERHRYQYLQTDRRKNIEKLYRISFLVNGIHSKTEKDDMGYNPHSHSPESPLTQRVLYLTAICHISYNTVRSRCFAITLRRSKMNTKPSHLEFPFLQFAT